MPMKNTGRAPVTKKQKKEIKQKDTRTVKEIQALGDKKPGKDDPRRTGK